MVEETQDVRKGMPKFMLQYMNILLFIMLIMLIVVLTICILKPNSKDYMNKEPRKKKSDDFLLKQKDWLMGQVSYVLLIVTALLASIVCVLVVLFAVVRGEEQRNLYQPDKLESYKEIKGNWYTLKSGGGLININPSADNTKTTRRVLFLHGNSLSLDAYAKALEGLAKYGYSVWAVEYGGYGIAKGSGDSPNGETVLRDSMEAYQFCGDSNTIVMGFSLGGAILGEIYDRLNPSPAQIVFINTFCDLPNLIQEKMKVAGPFLHPLMKTQWKTKKPKNYKNEAVVVTTQDDSVVTPEQGRRLCKMFPNAKCVLLPNGGHRRSALLYQDRWANPSILLSPKL